MVSTVTRILSMQVEDIIKSSACLDLMKCYSKLYLNGAAPRSCEASQRYYFAELQKNGIEKAKRYEMTQIRTCKPAFGGNLYISKYGFVHGEMITDEQAIYLLTNKLLPESMFAKLPDGYAIKQPEVNFIPIEKAEQPNTEIKRKRGRQPKGH